MNPTKFNTTVRFDGKYLRATLPSALQGRRFEAYYSEGTLIIAINQDGKGTKAYKSGTEDKQSAYVQFGQVWVKGCPQFKLKTEVEWDGRQFQLDVRQASAATAISDQNNSRAPVKKSDTAAASVAFLNKFSEENGYEFEIKAGKLSLVRVERIG